ncbi:MAG: amidohydrolase family protein [Longimicrobiales bacterium]
MNRRSLTTAFVSFGVLTATALPVLAQAAPPGGAGTKPLPLPAARKATFTATEGTWLSLDVSPDGQTIVFDLLGDLYTLPIAGGKASQLTSGMAFDAQPRWSPNGRTVVFVSDRSGGDNVWTIEADRSDTTQITQGNSSLYVSPEWTPDGDYIVVSRGGGLGAVAKLQMYHKEQRSPLPVVRGQNPVKTVGAAFGPDGRYVWFASRVGDWQYDAIFPQYQIQRYDREAGTSLAMTRRYGSGFRPAVSPDGNWLVYGTREDTDTGLRKRDLRTGEESWLAYPVQRDDMESRAPLDVLPGYSFTPDSEAIVVSYGGKIWRVPMDGTSPSEIPFEVEVELDVGPEVKFAFAIDTAAAVTAKQIRHPVTSPDGQRIVFTAFDRLWVKDLPNGDPQRLTDQDVGEYHPQWSPDGQWVAYVSWDAASGGHIMKAPVGGGAPVQLTRSAAMFYNVAWNPDGSRVVATRAAARELREASDIFFGPLGGDFVWVPSDGGEVTRIAPTGGRDVAHFVMDEPDRIYAYSFREGLVSFRWDGTDVEAHLQVRGSPAGAGGSPHGGEPLFAPRRVFPVGVTPDLSRGALEGGGPAPPAGLVMISPAGGRAMAQVGSDIYTVDIPEVGGPTPTVSVSNPRGAPVPVRKLTDVGGEFPAWSADGTKVGWSIGNALFSYDLAHVEAQEDTAQMVMREGALRKLAAMATNDSLKVVRAVADSISGTGAEVPDSVSSRIRLLRADSVQAAADEMIARADSMRAAAARIAAVADSVREGQEDVPSDTAAYKPSEKRIKVELPRDKPSGSVVLRGGRVLTMKGDEILEGADVVITNNRITYVGEPVPDSVPEGAEIIDVSGQTVMPGFVDTHYHAQWLVPEIHPAQAWQYLTNLAYGVTTTRDPQTATTDILSYQDLVETGAMLGPRTFSTGPGVFVSENIRNAEHAKTVLKRYSEYYDTKTLKMYMSGNRQQRQWIIQAAKELELMPTTEGGLDFKLNLTHAIDGYPGIEHALPIAPIYSDVVELFKASQTTNSPTLLVSYGGPFGENYFYATEEVHDDPKMRRFSPEESLDSRSRRRGGGAGPGGWFLKDEYVFEKHAEFVKALVEDSARAAVGSHGQLQGLGYHWELWAMGSGGLSNHDALRAATIYGAEAIGFDGQIGSLEAGKLADVIVLEDDPLADLRNTTSLRYVMRNGRLYEAETLNEVWPRQRALPAQPWADLGPGQAAVGVRR